MSVRKACTGACANAYYYPCHLCKTVSWDDSLDAKMQEAFREGYDAETARQAHERMQKTYAKALRDHERTQNQPTVLGVLIVTVVMAALIGFAAVMFSHESKDTDRLLPENGSVEDPAKPKIIRGLVAIAGLGNERGGA
jgi:hypothetical protein